ncbi:MAG: hypothetical protein JWM98_1277 [Thermoleophilia bacterium]|nr:hypothetical protein [Thermoleophilia bacterium]
MVAAHTPARCVAVPAHGRRRASEAAFSLVELIVVLVIVAILVAIVLPSVNNTRKSTSGPVVNVGSGAIWRGILDYRQEHQGVLPATSLVAGTGGANFKDPGNGLYVQRWPEGSDGKPLPVTAAGGGSAPTTVGATPGGSVLYGAGGATPTSGWVAGYSSAGRMVFRRGIAAGANPVVPLG